MKFVKLIDAGYFLAFAIYVLTRWSWNVRYLAGMALATCGFVLWMIAREQLGASFTVRAQARQLVTTGIYSKIRHPIYFFGGIAFGGLFLALGYVIPAVCFFAFYSIQLLRIWKEDKVLDQAFGEEYRRYKASTWF